MALYSKPQEFDIKRQRITAYVTGVRELMETSGWYRVNGIVGHAIFFKIEAAISRRPGEPEDLMTRPLNRILQATLAVQKRLQRRYLEKIIPIFGECRLFAGWLHKCLF